MKVVDAFSAGFLIVKILGLLMAVVVILYIFGDLFARKQTRTVITVRLKGKVRKADVLAALEDKGFEVEKGGR